MGLSCGTWDLCCGMQYLSLWCMGFSLVAARGLSSCGVQAPERMGSVVVARGLSCPVAFGILVP